MVNKSKVENGYSVKGGRMTSVRRMCCNGLMTVALDDCLSRLEHVSTDDRGDTWWLALSRGDRSMTILLTSASPIEVTLTQDNPSRRSRGRKRR